MFIQNLFEDAPKRVVVTYPGRFQPFHKGHAEVFANLQRKFGSDNVFIVTSNKTDGGKSPFNFSDKVRFMNAMGIPNHQIIETDKVYDLPSRFEPIKDQVVFITVVGAPDEARLAPGRVKKDGSPGYFQQLPPSSNEFEPATKHGYVIVEPEHPEKISIGGKSYDVSHGTPCRALWNQVRDNPQQRAEFVQQLYGKADAELASTLDKIPNGAAPAPEPAKKMKNVKKDLTKVQHDPNAEQPVAEAGNRGYNHGFASPTAPSLGGQRRREDDEYHVPDPVDTSIWYIRANGKIIKDKMGTPFQFRSKEAARKSAMTMMAKPFNAGKKFVLTTQPRDEVPVTEGVAEAAGPVTHRIGLTVTDPNHPMVSKRGETYHKTVRVTGDDREKAINGAIAHYRRKGYKVHDHHYIGTVDNEPMAEGKRSDTYHIVNKDGKPVSLASYADKESAIKDRDAKHQGAEVRQLGPRGKVKGVSEGAELKQAKRKYNQAAKDANTDQVGAGKKIDTMKKSLRQKDLDNKKEIEEGATGAKPGWMLRQDPELAKKVKDSKAGHQALKKWAGKPVPKDDKQDIKEFAPPGSGDGDDGFNDETLKRMAAQWYNGDEDPSVERTLAAAGWEIGQDEGYDDEPGVFVVQSGDVNGNSYMSWPANELRQDVAEGITENAEELNVGDPVIITGKGIEFEGKTGDIDSFGDMKRFVVVNLYNYGKHSFHSSDVSSNEYVDPNKVDESMYQYNKEDPYNSEFAPDVGMGRMTLRGWKQQMIKRTAELAQQMSDAGQDLDKNALWDNVYKKLKSMNMDPIAQEIEQAQAELEKIRQRGGVRSRAFAK